MKKGLRLLVASILVLPFSFSFFTPHVSAEKKSTISGRITTTIEFDKEYADTAKKWMGRSLEVMKEDLNERLKKASKEEAKRIRKALKEVEKTKVEDMFKTYPDGSADLKSPLTSVEVKVGNKTTVTDKHGKYVLSGLPLGKQKMIISKNGHKIREIDIVVEKGKPKMNIDIQLYDEQFIANAKRMSQGMAHHTHKASVQKDDVHAQEEGIRDDYRPLNRGDVVGFGRGATRIQTNPNDPITNIVSCNEADRGVTLPRPGETEPRPEDKDPLDDTESFPFNNSDCSRSIALGIQAQDNFILAWFYGDSINCYIESIQNVMGREGDRSTAVYCNGLEKDGHWNCSHFNGIEHPEHLHTHIY